MTRDKIIADVADTLGVDQDTLDPDISLTDYGLDSLRLIMLAEKWRMENIEVDFHELLSRDTLTQWFELYSV